MVHRRATGLQIQTCGVKFSHHASNQMKRLHTTIIAVRCRIASTSRTTHIVSCLLSTRLGEYNPVSQTTYSGSIFHI